MGSNGEANTMKQVITTTKGHRRHTFKQVAIKATMITSAPYTLDDEEIADFIRRTWLTYKLIDTGIQYLIEITLHAKGNNTGRTFGTLIQANTSVSSTYTDFLNVVDEGTGSCLHSYLRFTMVNTTLIRSETLAEELTPSVPCPGAVYGDYTIGGAVIVAGCPAALLVINQTSPLNQSGFLGKINTSSVAILTGFLGNGMDNTSSLSLSQNGMIWMDQHGGHIDSRLIFRGMLMGGNASAVMVDVGTTVAAISDLQLFLCILPAYPDCLE